MANPIPTFKNLAAVVSHLRTILNEKKYILIFGHNGVGKTRLSMEFKHAGRNGEERDTLYFNAFTEDLFGWNNDLKGDKQRELMLNTESRFFNGLQELEMENKIGPLLERYVDFNFKINYDDGTIKFSRQAIINNRSETIEYIKVSRGEENIFIWCFFLAIAQLAIDEQEQYKWVKYIYIDDPISSLDDNNAITVASHLAQLLKSEKSKIKTIISTHHTLFFNVMCNELGNAVKYILNKGPEQGSYILKDTGDTPLAQHIFQLVDLCEVAESGDLFTHHFNILRNILERTATFHGYRNFSACIKKTDEDKDGQLHARIINILSHGNYSLYEAREMQDDNKEHFRNILRDFMNNYKFNPQLFQGQKKEEEIKA